MTLIWQRRGNLKRETESLLIIAHNIAVKTNYIKAKIDNLQPNNNCWLCGNKDETVYHMISNCSKLTEKENKTRHDWVGKLIHWELCKRLKFDHSTKPELILENKTHSILTDFEILTNHINSGQKTRPSVNKENLQSSGFCHSGENTTWK